MPTKKKQVSTKVETKPESKQLYRSQKDRILAGVCGGLGEYFNVDPIIFRLLFVVVTLSGGAGLLIYIVLWIVMPEVDQPKYKNSEEAFENKVEEMAQAVKTSVDNRNTQMWLGVIIMILGVFFLFSSLGITRYFNLSYYLSKLWPLLIIVLGIIILLKSNNGKE